MTEALAPTVSCVLYVHDLFSCLAYYGLNTVPIGYCVTVLHMLMFFFPLQIIESRQVDDESAVMVAHLVPNIVTVHSDAFKYTLY